MVLLAVKCGSTKDGRVYHCPGLPIHEPLRARGRKASLFKGIFGGLYSIFPSHKTILLVNTIRIVVECG
jgi:hypothetical protein